MASIRAMRALARATFVSTDWDDARRLMLERVNKPTAMTVRRIISDNVTTKANPACRVGTTRGFDFPHDE
jgi:hypothetical protein